jgi:hypothetical protein
MPGTFLLIWSLNRYEASHESATAADSFFLSNCSSVLASLVSYGYPGGLVFHYAWAHDTSNGLFVLTYFPEASFFRHVPCAQAWVVRVESNEEWYLNSKRIEPDHLPEALRAQIGGRTSCIVFFDAKSDVPYAEAIHAIGLIEQSPGRVVLLTPETKRVHIP